MPPLRIPSFAEAMSTILNPVQLRFRIEGNEVVLYRR
jgi:hypothetical protein